MSDGENQGPGPEEERPPKTPFDNPLFLPVVLWAFTLWFAYDAWIVPMEEHLAFNRYGFFVALAAAIWFTRTGLRERREEKAAAEREGGPLNR
ncbi:MAG: hypothetical protein VX546_15470 [Myxococcota bacterium]|nr:hypothetical protein [Myxococcota bacterium]